MAAPRLLVSGNLAACAICGVQQHVVVPLDEEFRCETCAMEEVDRAVRANWNKGLGLLAVGAVLLLFAALMWGANWNPGYEPHSYDSGMGLFFYVFFGAIGAIGCGLALVKFRRKLRT